MKSIAAITVVLASLNTAVAQPGGGGMNSVRSSSGQFVVFAAPAAPWPSHLAALTADTNYIHLQPALLVVSCERIKRKLWQELGTTAQWRGRICLDLRAAGSADDRVVVVTERLPSGWNYRLALPDLMERDRFVRAIVHVLLLEISNRGAGAHPAEIPTWLAEGLARDLRAASERELILPPPGWNVHGLTISPDLVNDERWSNPLNRAHQELRARPPLTFEQLSWPAEGQLTGAAGELYRNSAQLLVSQLLYLKNGQACLQTMLNQLPRHHNWQLAFLNAFRSHFGSLLEVEKWWALRTVQFTGRDLSQTWTSPESWRKLDEILHSPVDVRRVTNELPLHAVVDLQTIVREWESARQIPTLQRKQLELDLLRPRVALEAVPLVDDYRGAIQNYLQKRGVTSTTVPPRKPAGTGFDRRDGRNDPPTGRTGRPPRGVAACHTPGSGVPDNSLNRAVESRRHACKPRVVPALQTDTRPCRPVRLTGI